MVELHTRRLVSIMLGIFGTASVVVGHFATPDEIASGLANQSQWSGFATMAASLGMGLIDQWQKNKTLPKISDGVQIAQIVTEVLKALQTQEAKPVSIQPLPTSTVSGITITQPPSTVKAAA